MMSAKKKVKKVTKRKSKSEKLLNHMRKVGGLKHEQIVKFMLRGTGSKYDRTTRRYFDSTLYGTNERVGILEGFCWRRRDGVWKVKGRAKIQAPFNPRRSPDQPRPQKELNTYKPSQEYVTW